jgi:hypothetical protein
MSEPLSEERLAEIRQVKRDMQVSLVDRNVGR